MAKMDEFKNLEDDGDGMDILIDAAAICLKKDFPEMWDSESNSHAEEAEEALDMPTIYRVLKVCGGVDLQDPNLVAAAAEALGKTLT